MKKIALGFLAMAVTLVFSAGSASAYKVNDDHTIYGYGQVWLLLSEDAKSGDSVSTARGDSGQTTAFGFRDRRARFGMKGNVADGMVFYNFFVDGAGGTLKLLDYWVGLNAAGLKVTLGRFRPFVTYAGGIQGSAGLKNIERASGIKSVNSKFYVANAGWRDLGIRIAYGNMKKDPLAILFSATNGGGANETVGGDVSKGDIYSNNIADAAYSIGVISNLMDGALRVGASYSMNKHDALVLKGGESALDLDRSALSVNAKLGLMDGALWLDGEYASLTSGDDDAVLAGGEEKAYFARAGFFVAPKSIELVARYGNHTVTPKGGDDAETTETTVGVNYYLGPFKAQLEYTAFDPDGGDSYNAIRTMFQAKF